MLMIWASSALAATLTVGRGADFATLSAAVAASQYGSTGCGCGSVAPAPASISLLLPVAGRSRAEPLGPQIEAPRLGGAATLGRSRGALMQVQRLARLHGAQAPN